jgi:hypothetical protein
MHNLECIFEHTNGKSTNDVHKCPVAPSLQKQRPVLSVNLAYSGAVVQRDNAAEP